jgi:uncharacterized protein (TIGR03790 family)
MHPHVQSGRRRFLALMAWVGWLLGRVVMAANPPARADEAAEVAVIYSLHSADSKSVAQHYAAKRGVPAAQVIGINVPVGDNITRPDYERLIQDELIRQFRERDLVTFMTDLQPSRPGRPGRVLYRAISSKIRYLVLCWGIPYRIPHDPNYDPNHLDEIYKNLPAHLQRDEGSVDGELSLLPIAGRTSAWGPVRNPMYGMTNFSVIHPTNGVFMVTRIDGPSVAIANGLVDKALIAERDGLNGRAYVDMRGLTAGSYVLGDLWMTNVATVARRHGFETVVDVLPETFSIAQPFAQVAVYAGWYAAAFDGPFRLPVVEFMPGAIAYHLHSYSAYWVRFPDNNWLGPLLAKGATVTMGCIEEPYLEMTPNIGTFMERLADYRATVGEAAVVSQAVFSWQTVVVGDPLYRPFGRTEAELEAAHRSERNPVLEWDLWKKANLQLLEKRPADAVLRELLSHPVAGKSAILAERIARLYHDVGQTRAAAEWGERSLQAGGSPQQRGQLMRMLAAWQAKSDPKSAMSMLDQFAREFPGHPEILIVLNQELELAKSLKRNSEAQRIQSLIRTLTPPPTNAPALKEK